MSTTTLRDLRAPERADLAKKAAAEIKSMVRKGRKRTEIAKAIGVSRENVGQWVRGESRPIKNLAEVIEFLRREGVSLLG